jgi:hypothetical protein
MNRRAYRRSLVQSSDRSRCGCNTRKETVTDSSPTVRRAARFQRLPGSSWKLTIMARCRVPRAGGTWRNHENRAQVWPPFAPRPAVARRRPPAGMLEAEVRTGGKKRLLGRRHLDRRRNAWGQGRLVCQMLNHHAGQRGPKLPDRLVGVLLSCVVQTDALLSGDETPRRNSARALPPAKGSSASAPGPDEWTASSACVPCLLLYALRRLARAVALVVILPPARSLVVLTVDRVRVDVCRHAHA